MSDTLIALRKEILSLDKKLLTVLKQRMKVSMLIGKLKKESAVPVVDGARRDALFEQWQKMNSRGQFSPVFIKRLFKSIHDESVRIQKKVL